MAGAAISDDRESGFRRNSLTGFRGDINEVVLASSRCASGEIESKTEIREHL